MAFAGLSNGLTFGNAANGLDVSRRPLADGPHREALRQIFSPRDDQIGARQDDAGNEPGHGILQLKFSPMQRGGGLYDRETEAIPGQTAALVEAVEAFGDAGSLRWRNPRPVILNDH